MESNQIAVMEISFNIAYLITIWGLVAAMLIRHRKSFDSNRKQRSVFIMAFIFLAFGDTGHVGFRILAHINGDLLPNQQSLSSGSILVGLGALATAITVTIFYMLLLVLWNIRYKNAYGYLGAFLFFSAASRFFIMVFPQNDWSSAVPPQPWSIFRNIPLLILGLGTAYLIIRDAIKNRDKAFMVIGLLILISYAFYIPVILLVQVAPLVGMFMIPKTLAYIGVAVAGYIQLFKMQLGQSETQRQAEA